MKRFFLISSGRGPLECRRAVRAVAAAFIEAIESIGLEADYLPGSDPDGEGPVSAIVLVFDEKHRLDAILSGWTGTIQWISKSERRAKASRKNWFVSLGEEPFFGGDTVGVIRESDVIFSAIAAGGPGGQHQNKTASAVRAEHRPSGITVIVRTERSQHRNKAIALERIAGILEARRRQEIALSEKTSWSSRIDVQRGSPVRTIRQAEGRDKGGMRG